jgi:hypothetical protein
MDRPAANAPPAASRGVRRLHRIGVPLLLILAAVLAVSSLVTDSATFDEPFHLTAGMSYLKTGDFRMSPDHPPLARVWAAWPLLFSSQRWPASDLPAWREVDVVVLARTWLFELNNGQRLIRVARLMMVPLFLGTCLAVYWLGRELFGPTAGLLALVLASLSPSLLAHGRLITTDLPATLCFTLVLLTFGRLLRRMTWRRLAAAGAALAAACVTKLSWPLVLPALATMAGVVIFSRREIETGRKRTPNELPRRFRTPAKKAVLTGGISLVLGLAGWVGIWTGYGWRASLLAPPPVGASPADEVQWEEARAEMEKRWVQSLHHTDNTPRRGPVAAFVRFAAEHGLLPEAYIFGLARTMHFTSARRAYLMGEFSNEGWASYFPIAFAIKTPIATILLLLGGLAAILLRRGVCRDNILLVGALTFVLIYTAFIIQGRVNIGHRHLLPVYPPLLALAGGSAVWLSSRVGRVLVGLAVVWLIGANLWIHPQYLAYFNEIAGGPANGHRWLLDSNLDWGQDLLRLRDYADAHPRERIKLCYFGSAIPTRYLQCEALPSYFDFEPRAALNPGTYVVSATQLFGVYDDQIRDSFWDEEWRRLYAEFGARFYGQPATPDETPEMRAAREQASAQYESLRYKRLLNRLQKRQEDARIGRSMFVYRLSAEDIAELTRP